MPQAGLPMLFGQITTTPKFEARKVLGSIASPGDGLPLRQDLALQVSGSSGRLPRVQPVPQRPPGMGPPHRRLDHRHST